MLGYRMAFPVQKFNVFVVRYCIYPVGRKL
jgi:hypothetical protein